MTIYCGVSDSDGISPFYKASITQEVPGVGNVTVTGYITGETQIQLSQDWGSPFSEDTAGNVVGEKSSSLGQSMTGVTTKTLLNSKLVWNGSEPLMFDLELSFIAIDDAKREVNDPIMYLKQMSSPELNDLSPLGQVPQEVQLNIGRRLLTKALIKEVSYAESAPKTKDGYFVSNKINVTLSLDGVVNASQIPNIFK